MCNRRRHRSNSILWYRFYRVCCSGTISRSVWKRFAVFSTVGFSALLVYLCLTEVQPAIQGLKFIQTTCSINKTEVTEYVPCTCGAYTKSACYPCLIVMVSFNASTSTGGTDLKEGKIAYLYKDLYFLRQKCFFQPSSCCDSKDKNRHAVETKRQHLHGQGHQFLCYYNPHNPRELILHRHFYEVIIMNSFVWPSVGIAGSIFILRYLRRLRMEEERYKIKILLQQAREYKPTDDDKGLDKPGHFAPDEDVWVLRKNNP